MPPWLTFRSLLAVISLGRVMVSGIVRFFRWLHGPARESIVGWLSPADIAQGLAAVLFYSSLLVSFAAMMSHQLGDALTLAATAIVALTTFLNRLFAGPAQSGFTVLERSNPTAGPPKPSTPPTAEV